MSSLCVCDRCDVFSLSSLSFHPFSPERLDADDYDDGSYGPVLVRLAWHCAGTYDKKTGTGGSNGEREKKKTVPLCFRLCNTHTHTTAPPPKLTQTLSHTLHSGATMRFAPESDHGANAGLGVARALLEPIKKRFSWISYADLYTLAGVVAVEEMGGPTVAWTPGRTDAADGTACPTDGRLPDASQAAAHLRDIFYRMGFDDKEIVALSGAHTLGRCHADRSGFVGPWTRAPITMSNQYFDVLVNEKWSKKKWGGPLQYEDKSGELMMLPT